MSRLEQLALSDPARRFAERLLARHPDWEPFLTAYERTHPDDQTEPGSLCVEVPSPHDPDAPLWAVVQSEEALVGLGHRAAEALYVWQPHERDAAIESVLHFIDEIVSADVVGVWERHRFLWRTWETCHFHRAAEAARDARTGARVSAWPPLPGHRAAPRPDVEQT